MQRYLKNACIVTCKISQRWVTWVNQDEKKVAETEINFGLAQAGFDLEKYT